MGFTADILRDDAALLCKFKFVKPVRRPDDMDGADRFFAVVGFGNNGCNAFGHGGDHAAFIYEDAFGIAGKTDLAGSPFVDLRREQTAIAGFEFQA